MNYKVLYRKYRPTNFDELIGQDHIKDLLMNSIVNNKLSHAYLFTGPRGTGKTSTAKLFAKAINCEKNNAGNPCGECLSCENHSSSIDIIEIDAASNNGVDKIRELRDNVEILPNLSKYKVYIIDEVHMLTGSSWNAFLKTLEEPPAHVIFILATTEIQKVPITILSRCQRFDFQKISTSIIAKHIKEISKKEKIQIDDDSILEIASMADGGLRDSLSILDQLSKMDKAITLDELQKTFGLITNSDILKIYDFFLSGNAADLIENIDVVEKKGVSSEVFLKKMLDFLLDKYLDNKISGKLLNINLNELIFDLEDAYSKKNKYLIIKTVFLNNMDVISKTSVTDLNVQVENQESNIVAPKEQKTLSVETESEEEKIVKKDISDSAELTAEIVNIRINNSFAGAKKALKEDFIKKWSNLEKHLLDKGDTKYLSLVKNSKVEVVSPTNVILSTKTNSNSVLFNLICDEITDNYKKILGNKLKIVCLDAAQWQREKENYIELSKTSTYEYIDEPVIKQTSKSLAAVIDIFGEDVLVIK